MATIQLHDLVARFPAGCSCNCSDCL